MSISKSPDESKILGMKLAKFVDKQFVSQDGRKDTRRISLPNAVQAYSKHRRRGTIHHTEHGLSDQFKTAQSPLNILYASKTVKAYRQRRALHHKQLTKRSAKEAQDASPPQETPIERFRKAVRLVTLLRHAFDNIVFYATQKGRHEQITSETTLSLKATVAKGTVEDLLFDPEDYKCQYKDRLPLWAKQVTEKDPCLRTNEEIKLMVRLLKQLKGFRRYSPEVQTSICSVIKYDEFGRRRVIIRKGHVAQRLYFIYSGSVCVSIDEDEESAFAKPETERACLNRGDYFGELAFLKNVRRAATIVCLEKTEFLSVDKEDFFATGVDKCFTHDLDKRIEFLSHHPVFVTWSRSALHHIAEVSRVHEYHCDEVIVKNSFTSNWLFFITKGQCDILRLVDLRNCSAYRKYSSRIRTSSVTGHNAMYSSNNSLTPDSLMIFKTFPIVEENEEDEEDAPPTGVFSSHSDINIHRKHYTHENTGSRTKSAVTKKSRSWRENSAEQKRSQKQDLHRNALRHAVNKDSKAEDVGLGVYMVVERLTRGQHFGAWSILNVEDLKVRSRTIIDERRFTLLSGGCEVIKMPKKEFHKLADYETIEQLRELTSIFPNDNELCQTYMKLNDWRSYREELVDNLIEKKVAAHEMSVGLWRSPKVRSSPVPSPLCSFRPQHPVVANWEYFRGSGWTATKVTSPVVKAGQKQKVRSKSHAGISTPPHPSIHQTRPSRPRSLASHTSSRYPLNTQPLVGDKLVVAKGSHRALVLTHGGIRCNDFVREVEQVITRTKI